MNITRRRMLSQALTTTVAGVATGGAAMASTKPTGGKLISGFKIVDPDPGYENIPPVADVEYLHPFDAVENHLYPASPTSEMQFVDLLDDEVMAILSLPDLLLELNRFAVLEDGRLWGMPASVETAIRENSIGDQTALDACEDARAVLAGEWMKAMDNVIFRLRLKAIDSSFCFLHPSFSDLRRCIYYGAEARLHHFDRNRTRQRQRHFTLSTVLAAIDAAIET